MCSCALPTCLCSVKGLTARISNHPDAVVKLQLRCGDGWLHVDLGSLLLYMNVWTVPSTVQYIDILEEVMIPSVRALLIPEPLLIYITLDNSTVHSAAIVTDWFRHHPEVIRVQWPAKSPDLMPIENLGAQMKKKWGDNNVKTTENLVVHTMNVWESLRPKRGMNNICETLVRSTSDRLNKVIDCKGFIHKILRFRQLIRPC